MLAGCFCAEQQLDTKLLTDFGLFVPIIQSCLELVNSSNFAKISWRCETKCGQNSVAKLSILSSWYF